MSVRPSIADEGYVEVEPGLRLNYVAFGDPAAADTVVFPAASWAAADVADLGRNRRVLMYDQRNRGHSDATEDPERMTLEYELRDLEAMRRAFGLDRMKLIGWSCFGAVVALYAAAHPEHVARLVMIGAMTPRETDYPGQKTREELDARLDPAELRRLEQMRADGLETSDPAAYCRASCRAHMRRSVADPAAIGRMRSDPCAHPNEWLERIEWRGEHLFGPLRERDWRPDAARVAAPALLVHGTEDFVPLGGAHEWASHLRDARAGRSALRPFPLAGSAGHLLSRGGQGPGRRVARGRGGDHRRRVNGVVPGPLARQ